MRIQTLALPVAILLTAALLSSCATLWRPSSKGPPCEIRSPSELWLRGATDAAMLACVAAADLSDVRTVVLDSPGGSVREAIAIADRLQPLGAAMIVRGGCISSCANYVLPVARSITLEPDAVIILHGGIDEGLAERTAARLGGELGEDQTGFQDLVAQQRDFAARNRIPPGWLLYRATAEEYARGGVGAFVTGAVDVSDQPQPVRRRYIMVEEAFITSCLGHIAIAPFEDTRVQRAYRDERLRRRLARQGAHPSGTLACVRDEMS